MYEQSLRPSKQIGWNNAAGGSHGWRIGFNHSEKTKEILKKRWTPERKIKASDFKKEQNKKLIGQKRPKQSVAMTGSKNPMFGTKRPEHVKEAMRLAHVGKPAYNRQENYCVGCHERASMTVIKKYHTKCFRSFMRNAHE